MVVASVDVGAMLHDLRSDARDDPIDLAECTSSAIDLALPRCACPIDLCVCFFERMTTPADELTVRVEERIRAIDGLAATRTDHVEKCDAIHAFGKQGPLFAAGESPV